MRVRELEVKATLPRPVDEPFVVLAIDPGFANLGVAALAFTATSRRVIKLGRFGTGRGSTDEQRLDQITDYLLQLVLEVRTLCALPTIYAYESQAGVFAGANAAEGQGGNFASRRVLEVCGIIRAVARVHRRPCYAIAPISAKVAVLGKGARSKPKEDVARAVTMLFGIDHASSHEFDAVSIGVAARRKHATLRTNW